ncbi:MAG: antitoxin [Segetibacter sp.]|nr:antitoxin [Segetibacter sp.]
MDEIKAWLYDVLNAIHEIETFLIDAPNFSSYENDLKTRRAIERNLEIIGEAVARMQKAEPSIYLSHARKIIDTRNRIIHGYDTVSDEIIWGIITIYLPVLKQEVNKLLND